jgi:hypothetical protein
MKLISIKEAATLEFIRALTSISMSIFKTLMGNKKHGIGSKVTKGLAA